MLDTNLDLQNIPKFDKYPDVYENYLSTEEKLMISLADFDAISNVEICVNTWMKIMEKVGLDFNY